MKKCLFISYRKVAGEYPNPPLVQALLPLPHSPKTYGRQRKATRKEARAPSGVKARCKGPAKKAVEGVRLFLPDFH